MENQNQTTTEQKLWMSAREVAQYMGVSLSSIDRFKRDFKMPFSKLGGTVKFHKGLIDTWMLDHTKHGL